MKILRLELENFRGIKNLAIDFDGKDTDIFGANGTGKTTVANAICWLLIDRPATEEPDFDPKTTGAHGIHHVATIEIETESGNQISLSKDFYEKWTRKRGAAESEFTGNTTDYFIDGVRAKKKQYTAAVERACGTSLDNLKMLMVLGYFADTMSTDDKRKILFEMAGDFTDADIFAQNESLQALAPYLVMPGSSGKSYAIEQWQKIAKEQRLKLNKDLELLPTRMDEAAKGIPEEIADEAALQTELRRLEKEKAAAEEERRTLLTEDGKKDAIRTAVANLRVEMENARAAYIKEGVEKNRDIHAAIDKLSGEKRTLAEEIDTIKRKVRDAEAQKERMAKLRTTLMEEYAAAQAEQWDAGKETCPTCGQTLPAEKVQELRAAFNERKAQQKESINRRGQECSKAKIQQLEEAIAAQKAEVEAKERNLADIDERLSNLQGSLMVQPPFETTEEYTLLTQRLEELQDSERSDDSAQDETVRHYAAKVQAIQEAIAATNLRIAEAKASEESKKRVAELEASLKETAAQMEHIEHGIHLAEEFVRTKARMVTDSINGHFNFVRFVLFREQINGGLKEICEPTLENKAGEWVEYRSANYAAQVNAKVDIIGALSKHYGVTLPILMDQAESVTAPLPVDGQLIRFIVSAPDTEALRIKTKD